MQNFFYHHYELLLVFLLLSGFLSGLVDAMVGGGGLISLPALTFTGLPLSIVFGTNKVQGCIGTAVATYKYYRSGLINFATVYRGLIFGFIGAILGAVVVNYVANDFMKYIVPFLMLAVFFFNLINKKLGVKQGKKRMSERLFFAVFGFLLSFYDAFFGPGTGNFWIILIVYFLGYTFLQASGYAKMLNLKSNLFASAVFVYYNQVDWVFSFVMFLGQMVGGYLGASLVVSKGSEFVRPFFMLIIFINIIMLFYQLLV